MYALTGGYLTTEDLFASWWPSHCRLSGAVSSKRRRTCRYRLVLTDWRRRCTYYVEKYAL